MEIKLFSGEMVKIDEEDYEIIKNYKWRLNKTKKYKYAVAYKLKSKNKTVVMHRLIMKATKRQMIDHINGDGLDNRKLNLRFCNKSLNAANSCLHRDNKSGYKGVHWSNRDKKWYSQITLNYKQRLIGLYDNKDDAACAYDKVAQELFGKFARINFSLNTV